MNKLVIWALGILALIILGIFVLVTLIFQEKENNAGTTYNCKSDSYNCDDFSSQKEAQKAFDFCAQETGDIHQLDKDGNSIACESLE